MERMMLIDGNFDEGTYRCQIVRFDPEEDRMYLELKEKNLTSLSLDAKYRCTITTRTETIHCSGAVRERFRMHDRNMICYKVENGFFDGDGTVTDVIAASP